MGRPKIDDEWSHLSSRQTRWAKRNPDKAKAIKKRYEQSDKGRAAQKRYRDKKSV